MDLTAFGDLSNLASFGDFLAFGDFGTVDFPVIAAAAYAFFLFFFLLVLGVLGGVTGNGSSVDGCFIRSYTLCR